MSGTDGLAACTELLRDGAAGRGQAEAVQRAPTRKGHANRRLLAMKVERRLEDGGDGCNDEDGLSAKRESQPSLRLT